MGFEILKKHRSFEGETIFCQHDSSATKTKMKFSAYLPREKDHIDSALIWLSGLTCSEENFITKAGAQSFLSATNTMLICPDTSPRGLNIPGADESYDFGTGAGFYVNALTGDFKENYNMYDYIAQDIVALLKNDFEVSKYSVFGHSMGGHGALILGLRNPSLFKSVSAFSPITNPMQCPWGQKAFQGYLGEDKNLWKAYDACELLKEGFKRKDALLVEQGLDDEFLEKQLMTKNLETLCSKVKQKLIVNYREGYDHSYYFISSFIGEHVNFHLEHLSSP